MFQLSGETVGIWEVGKSPVESAWHRAGAWEALSGDSSFMVTVRKQRVLFSSRDLSTRVVRPDRRPLDPALAPPGVLEARGAWRQRRGGDVVTQTRQHCGAGPAGPGQPIRGGAPGATLHCIPRRPGCPETRPLCQLCPRCRCCTTQETPERWCLESCGGKCDPVSSPL